MGLVESPRSREPEALSSAATAGAGRRMSAEGSNREAQRVCEGARGIDGIQPLEKVGKAPLQKICMHWLAQYILCRTGWW